MILAARLRKQVHREIAKAQDLIVEAVYTLFDDAVMHGGTAIWRCYHGGRFSEDVDVYLPKNRQKIELLFQRFERQGFQIEKKKIGENSIYSSLRLGNTLVRFEALYKKMEGHLADYETVDGNFVPINALTPEELIVEKVQAYLQRRKIRDVYDIFILLKLVQDRTEIQPQIEHLLAHFPEPLDEQDLNVIIFEGTTPTSQKMREYIQTWARRNIEMQ